ncbi:YeiH family protein [Pseudonocardia sp. GCM10023141]|uniref:YeiH family protein n=1 Tax=Pseudonocardia sp. GCM10023141 TaxID=3252653 RepID=UPI00360B133E
MPPRPHPAGIDTTGTSKATPGGADSHSAAPTPRSAGTPLTTRVRRAGNGLPGFVLAVAVAVVATFAGIEVPVVGGPVFGIVLGVLVATVLRPGDRLRPGLAFAARPVLQGSIVLLGATLSLQQVAQVGRSSLPVMLGTLAVALLGACGLGRLLGVRGDTQLLIGVGTGICGASAIAATQAVIRAKDSQVAYAIGTIFTFNIVAVLAFPQIGHLLHLTPHAFGLWAGTAINDTSSVVAAAYAYGGDAGSYAVVVKLTRSLMIIPIVTALTLWAARREPSGGQGSQGFSLRALPWRKLVPVFLVGFVAAAALNSAGVVPSSWHSALTVTGTFLITTALAGIGLSLRLGDLRRAGIRPLLLGAGLWVLVAAASLGLQAVTGTL